MSGHTGLSHTPEWSGPEWPSRINSFPLKFCHIPFKDTESPGEYHFKCMCLCQAPCEYNPAVSQGPSAPCILDFNYLHYCGLHTLCRISAPKVWRRWKSLSYLCSSPGFCEITELFGLEICLPIHPQAELAFHQHAWESHQSRQASPVIWDLGRGHHIKDTPCCHHAHSISLRAASSLSPHSSPPASWIPTPQQFLSPVLCNVSFSFKNQHAQPIQAWEPQFLPQLG